MSSSQSNCFKIVQDLIKLRWVPEILKSLSLGNHQYSQILRSIPHLSHTELNRKLIILRKRGAICKQSNANKIHYSLIEFGEDLVHIFNHLEDLQAKYFRD